MDPQQAQVIMQLVSKYQSRVLDIVKIVKENKDINYEDLGHKAADVINDILNISIKDFI